MRLVIEHEGRRYPVAEGVERLRLGGYGLREPLSPSAAFLMGRIYGMVQEILAGEARPDEAPTVGL